MRTPPSLPFLLPLCIAGCQTQGNPPPLAHEAHVSPSGSNRFNDGSRQRPFESLSAALAAERHFHIRHPGEIFHIHLHGGTYFLTETLILGPEDSHTTLAAWPGEKPVLVGGQAAPVTLGADGAWRIPSARAPENLLIGGTGRAMACEPNQGFFQISAIERVALGGDAEEHRIQVAGEARAALTRLFAAGLTGARVEVLHKWDTTTEPVVAWDSAAGTLTTRGRTCKPWNPLQAGCRFRVWNAPGGADAPGEWVWKDGVIRYLPKPGETVAAAPAVIPQLRQWLTVQGQPESGRLAQDIHVSHLAFAGTTAPFPQAGIPPAQAANACEAAVMADGARNLSFDHCTFAETAEYALWLRRGCTDCAIERSTLENLGAGGVRIGETARAPAADADRTGSVRVEDCRIVQGGLRHLSAVGVLIGHSGNNTVVHNEIEHLAYTGISVGWVWGYGKSEAENNQIAFNHIHHIGAPERGLLDDMGGIYTLGPARGTRIEGNRIHDIRADRYGGWGIYNDEGSTGIVVENNLVHDTEDGGYHQHYGLENTVRNNVFAFGRRHAVQASRVEDHLSLTFTRNLVVWESGSCNRSNWSKMKIDDHSNLYWCYTPSAGPLTFEGQTLAQLQAAGREAGSVVADPLFKDVAKRDFGLRAGSPALSVGFKSWQGLTGVRSE